MDTFPNDGLESKGATAAQPVSIAAYQEGQMEVDGAIGEVRRAIHIAWPGGTPSALAVAAQAVQSGTIDPQIRTEQRNWARNLGNGAYD